MIVLITDHVVDYFLKRVQCPACNSFISELDTECPECGYSIGSDELVALARDGNIRVIKTTATATLILIFLVVLFYVLGFSD